MRELAHREPYHRFICGNHDDRTLAKNLSNWIDSGGDGAGHFFVNGAWSIDKASRTPGYNWWPEEQHTEQELEQLIAEYTAVRPHTVVTHDCPTLAAYHLFLRGRDTYQKLTRTGEALQLMFEAHQPERWFFGHWHQTKSQKINGTQFQCLGIETVVEVDW